MMEEEQRLRARFTQTGKEEAEGDVIFLISFQQDQLFSARGSLQTKSGEESLGKDDLDSFKKAVFQRMNIYGWWHLP